MKPHVCQAPRRRIARWASGIDDKISEYAELGAIVHVARADGIEFQVIRNDRRFLVRNGGTAVATVDTIDEALRAGDASIEGATW